MRAGLAAILVASIYAFACGSPQQGVHWERFHACGRSTPYLIQGSRTGFGDCESSGMLHRESIRACPSFLPRRPVEVRSSLMLHDRPSALSSVQCARDEDCAGNDQYCEPVEPPGLASFCRDGCGEDSDCLPGQLCLCDYPIGRCVEARCRSDQDCGTGLLCGTYIDLVEHCVEGVEPVAFACQTHQDECANLVCGGVAAGWSGRCTLNEGGARYCDAHYEHCPIR
jgi:hypothetical protein